MIPTNLTIKKAYAYVIVVAFLLLFPFGQLLRINLTALGFNFGIVPADILALFSLPYLFLNNDILPALKGGVSPRRMTYKQSLTLFAHFQSSIHPHPEGWGFLERCYNQKILSYLKRIIFFFIASWVFSLIVFRTTAIVYGLMYLIRLVSYISFAFLVNYLCASERIKKNILNLTLVVLGFFMLLGACQFIFYYDLRDLYFSGWDDHYYRFVSTTLDPGYAAVVLNIGLVLVLAKNLIKSRYVKILFTVLFVTAVILTFSRAGYLTLLALLLYRFKKHFKKILLVAVVVVIFLLIVPKPRSAGVELLRTFSISSRVDDYKKTAEIFFKHPLFGVGYNNLCLFRVINGENNIASHSCSGSDSSLLTILATTGVVGSMIFFISFYKIIGLLPKDEYGHIVKMVIMVLLVSSLFNNTLFFNFNMGLFALFFGLSRKTSTLEN